jgi:hypothetical protein
MAVPSFPMQLSQTNLADWGSCVVPEGENKGKTFKEVVERTWAQMLPFQYLEWHESFCAYAYIMNEIHRMGAMHLFDFEAAAARGGGGGGGGGGGDASRSGGGDSFHKWIAGLRCPPQPHWTMLASDGRRMGRKRIRSPSSRSSGDAVNGGGGGDAVNGQDEHGGGGSVECDAVTGGGGDAVNGGGGGVECDKHGGGDAVNGQDNGDGMHFIVLKPPKVPHCWMLPMSNELRACCRSLNPQSQQVAPCVRGSR